MENETSAASWLVDQFGTQNSPIGCSSTRASIHPKVFKVDQFHPFFRDEKNCVGSHPHVKVSIRGVSPERFRRRSAPGGKQTVPLFSPAENLWCVHAHGHGRGSAGPIRDSRGADMLSFLVRCEAIPIRSGLPILAITMAGDGRVI